MRIQTLWIIASRSLLSMTVFSLLFLSFTDFNAGKLVEGLITDIYEYSDPKTKQIAINRFTAVCDYIVANKEVEAIKELCLDKEKLLEFRVSCTEYIELKDQNLVDGDSEFDEACGIILAPDFDIRCRELDQVSDIDISGMGELCELRNNNLIQDDYFFTQLMVTSLPEDIVEVPNFKATMPLLIILSILFAFSLFLAHKRNIKKLGFSLGRILFNIGVMCILAYSILYFYNFISSPDTSFILESIASENQPDVISERAIAVLVPLVLIKIINISFLYLGLILFTFGLTLKIVFKKSPANI